MLDIKSRSNDNNFVLEEKIEPKKFFKKNGILQFTLLIILIATLILSKLIVTATNTNISNELMKSGFYDDKLTRYAKNINRFFVYFNGYDYDKNEHMKNNKILYSQDFILENEKAKLTDEYYAKQKDIENTYNNKIDYETKSQDVLSSEDLEIIHNSEYEGNIFYYNENLIAEKEQKLAELKEEYENIFSDLENNFSLAEEENANYNKILSYIEQSPYRFLIKTKDGFITNINDELKITEEEYESLSKEIVYKSYFILTLDDYISEQKGNMHVSHILAEEFNGEILKDSFRKNGFSGYLFLPWETSDKELLELKSKVKISNHNHDLFENVMIMSAILIFGLVLFNIRNLKVFADGNKFYYGHYIKQKPIIRLISAGVLFVAFIVAFGNSQLEYKYSSLSLAKPSILFQIIILSAIILFTVLTVERFIIKLKLPKELREKSSVLYKTKNYFRKLTKDFYFVHRCKNIITIIAFYILVGTFIIALISTIALVLSNLDSSECILFILIFSICLLPWYYFYSFIVSHCKLVYYIEKMYRGEDVVIEETNPGKKELHYLNNLKRGFVESVNKMIKSERMKTELITNVSHDLKTPLTSIINYLELIKKEGLQGANTREYLDILEQKSQRLKFLIEDLFEASKLSSGAVELNISKVNIVDLLKQTIGELSEKIEEMEIDLRFNHDSENIYLRVDGKKIWRVFENLLNNIIKYSQPKTRAYINIEDERDEVIITFRNISNHEINFETKDLFERFKRGDDSRTTEGSGLGLSIAQSIVLLHEGHMDIIVDGDLFKVVIVLKRNK